MVCFSRNEFSCPPDLLFKFPWRAEVLRRTRGCATLLGSSPVSTPASPSRFARRQRQRPTRRGPIPSTGLSASQPLLDYPITRLPDYPTTQFTYLIEMPAPTTISVVRGPPGSVNVGELGLMA